MARFTRTNESSGLSDYELKRRNKMAEHAKVLRTLGLAKAQQDMTRQLQSSKSDAKAKSSKPTKAVAAPKTRRDCGAPPQTTIETRTAVFQHEARDWMKTDLAPHHSFRMLKLAASARSDLLRVGAFRVAGASAARAPCLARANAFVQRPFEAPRLFSSHSNDDDPWTKLAVRNPIAWQEAVKPAFHTFLELKKHLIVPTVFKVPSGDEAWPRQAWGYPLGRHATWLRKRWREGGDQIDPTQRKELDEMPFAWDGIQYKWDHFVLPALRTYYELNGHTDVPDDFRVPEGSCEWPEHLWGQFLGAKAFNIRNRGDFAKQVKADSDELKRLGFCHATSIYDRAWNERLIPALKAFRQEFGHCNVSTAFVVPSNSPWPEAAWGVRLGNLVHAIRTGHLGKKRDKSELNDLGFVWSYAENEWNERLLPALEHFHRVNGHCRVPTLFIVPSDGGWPKQLWGLRLGYAVDGIRNSNTYSAQVSRDKVLLTSIGFVWDYFAAEWSKRVFPALEAFFKVHGHSRVPISFAVPSESAWPEEAHGLKLGVTVLSIRNRGTYFNSTIRSFDSLDAIKFELEIPSLKWNERVEPLLATFEQLHGHRNVPRDFVVPSRSPWEERDWGISLGRLERKKPPRRFSSTKLLL